MPQLKLKLRTVEDVDRFRSKLQGVKIQLPGFKTFTIRQLGNDLILSTIHKKMRASGFSEKIILGTTLEKIEFTKKNMRLLFRSEYFEEAGFDVAVGREKGTKDHGIDAPEPTPERPNPHLLFEILGLKIFAKHVDVKGIPALFIIHNTIRELKEKFKEAYDKKFADWYVANMGGFIVAS